MQYSLPVILDYDGRKVLSSMGPFERSMERDFSLAVNKKAIEECSDMAQLKEVATKFACWLEQHARGPLGSLIQENIQLRHAIGMREADLAAAEMLMNEAAEIIDKETGRASKQGQSSQAKWRLWPW